MWAIPQRLPSSIHGTYSLAEIGTFAIGLHTHEILTTWILSQCNRIHTGRLTHRSFPRIDSQVPEKTFVGVAVLVE